MNPNITFGDLMQQFSSINETDMIAKIRHLNINSCFPFFPVFSVSSTFPRFLNCVVQCMYVCIRVSVHVYAHAFVRMCMRECTCACACVRVCVVSLCAYLCMCMFFQNIN